MKSSHYERCMLLDIALTCLTEDQLRYMLNIAQAEPTRDLSVLRWEAWMANYGSLPHDLKEIMWLWYMDFHTNQLKPASKPLQIHLVPEKIHQNFNGPKGPWIIYPRELLLMGDDMMFHRAEVTLSLTRKQSTLLGFTSKGVCEMSTRLPAQPNICLHFWSLTSLKPAFPPGLIIKFDGKLVQLPESPSEKQWICITELVKISPEHSSMMSFQWVDDAERYGFGVNFVSRAEHSLGEEQSDPFSVVSSSEKVSIPSVPLGEFEMTKRGGFGWTKKSGMFIPYFFRYRNKYCAIRILERSCKNHFGLSNGKPSPGLVYNRNIEINVTEPEARLLNVINYQHCDCKYGGNLFTCWDKAVPLSDVKQIISAFRSSMEPAQTSRGQKRGRQNKKKKPRAPAPQVMAEDSSTDSETELDSSLSTNHESSCIIHFRDSVVKSESAQKEHERSDLLLQEMSGYEMILDLQSKPLSLESELNEVLTGQPPLTRDSVAIGVNNNEAELLNQFGDSASTAEPPAFGLPSKRTLDVDSADELTGPPHKEQDIRGDDVLSSNHSVAFGLSNYEENFLNQFGDSASTAEPPAFGLPSKRPLDVDSADELTGPPFKKQDIRGDEHDMLPSYERQ